MNVIDQTMIEDNLSLIKKDLTINKDFDKQYNFYKQKIEALKSIKVDKEDI